VKKETHLNFELPKQIQRYVKASDAYFERLSPASFILVMTGASFLIRLIPVTAFFLFIYFRSGLAGIESFKHQGPLLDHSSIPEQFIFAVIFAPLFETFLNQWLVIRGLRKIRPLALGNSTLVILSALFFGLMHTYDLHYVMNTFFVGLVLAYAFIVYERKNSSPFRVVCTIHACINLGAMIVQNALK
jgi:hypothetical protein